VTGSGVRIGFALNQPPSSADWLAKSRRSPRPTGAAVARSAWPAARPQSRSWPSWPSPSRPSRCGHPSGVGVQVPARRRPYLGRRRPGYTRQQLDNCTHLVHTHAV
jgi:hypothetical protein